MAKVINITDRNPVPPKNIVKNNATKVINPEKKSDYNKMRLPILYYNGELIYLISIEYYKSIDIFQGQHDNGSTPESSITQKY